MTLICLASQKGSPGTTATALAVAAALKVSDGRRKLLLEADSAGGTLAIRYRMPVEPGLLTLAAAVRAGIESEGLWGHTQELPGGLPVVVCPDDSDQVHAAMAASGALLGHFLDGIPDLDVICDVGRLAPDSPSMAFVTQASALLMVARPTAEQLQPAARRLVSLRAQINNLGWVLVGRQPYGAAEVEATYDFPVVGLIADDQRSVASLERGGMSKRLRRHPFVRSSTTLADTLADWLAPIGGVPAGAAPEAAIAIAAPGPSQFQSRNSGPGLADQAMSPTPPILAIPSAPPTASLPETTDWPVPEWLPPVAEERSPTENTEDDWDGSEFTTTADLHLVFDRPHADPAVDVQPVGPVEANQPDEPDDLPLEHQRPVPPMPPPAARTTPPVPVLEGAASVPVAAAESQTRHGFASNGSDVNGQGLNGQGRNGSKVNGVALPPLPGPERRIQPELPPSFPHDGDDGDESDR